MVPTVTQEAIPAEVLSEHVGEWIALRDGHVVACADSLAELRKNPDVTRDDAVYVVPEPSSAFF